MADAAQMFAEVGRKMSGFLDVLIANGELAREWSAEATRLYKEQYPQKRNPYGEAWEYRAGDEKRRVSSWKFGKVSSTAPDGFSLIVARPNARRSCVPFEPRGLGSWKASFDEALKRRIERLARSFR